MCATQVLASPAAAEKIRNVLRACRHEQNARDYACRLVQSLAEVMNSQHAVWLDWSAGSCSVLAETEGGTLSHWLGPNPRVPLLADDRNLYAGIHSVAAAPITFRSSIFGVLAIANGREPYSPSDLGLLEEIGRAALAEYESLDRAEALGMDGIRQSIVELTHGLRQPLGILEACAFLLDMALPSGETRAREQLAEMLRQLDRASGILDESAQPYVSRTSLPRPDETDTVESDSRFLTQSAISMVT
jgi:GAF domain-containing protein